MTQNMSGHNAPPPSAPPACSLCGMWARLPHGARYSTPVPVYEVEVAMVMGFWLKSRHPADLAVRLCERHSNMLETLDLIQSGKSAEPTPAPVPVPAPAPVPPSTAMPWPGLTAQLAGAPFPMSPSPAAAQAAPMTLEGRSDGLCQEMVTDSIRCRRKAGHRGSHTDVPDREEPQNVMMGGLAINPQTGIPVQGAILKPVQVPLAITVQETIPKPVQAPLAGQIFPAVSAPTREAMAEAIPAGTQVPVVIQTEQGDVEVIAEQGSNETHPCPFCHKLTVPGKLHACES